METLLDSAASCGKTTFELAKLKALETTTIVATSLITRLSVILAVSMFALVFNIGIALLSSGLSYNRKTSVLPLFCPCSGLGLYRADALREIALPNMEIWDPDFFAYVDELDVGFRIRMLGYTADIAEDAIGYHKEGASSGGVTSDFSIFPPGIHQKFPSGL